MPNTVDHRHRDPLTLRVARTLRETVRDPYAWGEGQTEPQLLDVAKSMPHAARLRRAGCYGNCRQGRSACTMPGVCVRGARDAAQRATAPAPAEACTDVGHQHDDHTDERRRVQLIAGLLIGVLCVLVAFAFKALLP